MDSNRYSITICFAVVGFIGEAVGTKETRLRYVSKAAIRPEGEGSIADVADQYCGQRVAIRVSIVDQNTRVATVDLIESR